MTERFHGWTNAETYLMYQHITTFINLDCVIDCIDEPVDSRTQMLVDLIIYRVEQSYRLMPMLMENLLKLAHPKINYHEIADYLIEQELQHLEERKSS